ncbi:methyltransferase [Oceanihabitans sediminis]|uniref:methyltransferase n=1 Tax=Oceanihabitans sediminis TaxID=1812012 RepID=UPI00299E176A|nr:methyltransferase domain-containing protein [Oceanihabitans sediminis]MDX1279407.1 methyltransferase [Oceanihabitans sediminis]
MEKAGIGIGIITRGNISIKWMQHMENLKRHFPVGIFWKEIIVEGLGWAEGRNEVVRQAKEQGFEWLFFIDDDVFLPEDVFKRMLSHGKDIVTGIYWTKSDNSCPVIFEKTGSGPMFNFPIDEVFEVAGSGLGCALINMKVFDDFDKAGIPYFKENWIMELDDGKNMKCPVGEDHYFYFHAKKFGYKVWADSGILCDHYDINTKRFFPTEDIVRQITGKKLKEVGREDLIKKAEKGLGLDKDKKTIVFVNNTSNPFSGDELTRRGVGGAETALINLAKNLTSDYNIHVFCNTHRPGSYDDVIYHDIRTDVALISSLNPDLLISSRNTSIAGRVDFKNDFNAKQTALWLHDMPNSPANIDLEKSHKSFDKIIALTEFQKTEYMKAYTFLDSDKFEIVGHGVDKSLFKGKPKKYGSMIYSSTPFRGLDILIDVFPEIKKRVPEATLKVFSSMAVYGESDEEQYLPLYRKLKSMDGVEYYGSVTQDILADEMDKAHVLAYPNTFPETFCITALEAMAAGTGIVTSDFGALSETIPDYYGVKIKGNPYSQEYKDKFVESVVNMFKKDLYHAETDSWKDISRKWKTVFFGDVDSIEQAGNINTPEYWDKVYEREIKKDIRIRYDDGLANITIDNINNGDVYLDVGCGTGYLTRFVKDKKPNSEVWGSDFSLVAIDYCRQQNKKILYANHPLLNDDFEKDYFDVITIHHVLEHLEKPEEMIERARQLLKSDGKLIITIPINDDEWQEHLKIWSLIDVEELLRKFKCEYDLKFTYGRSEGTIKRYKNQRPYEQVTAIIKFIGE